MVNFLRSVLKILHRAEKIYTGGARDARDKYQVWQYAYQNLEVILIETREETWLVDLKEKMFPPRLNH